MCLSRLGMTNYAKMRKMVRLLKFLIKQFGEMTRPILKVFGEAFADPKFSASLLWKQVFVQKIIGINRHVPWPVHWTSQIKAPENIIRGNRCPGLSLGCYLDGRNGIEVGENTWIGPGVTIISMNHDLLDYTSYVKSEPIRIGNDCWIAGNAVILAGVELGDHTVVAAGAVVTRSFPSANQIVAGVPARVIGQLDPYLGREGNQLSMN